MPEEEKGEVVTCVALRLTKAKPLLDEQAERLDVVKANLALLYVCLSMLHLNCHQIVAVEGL